MLTKPVYGWSDFQLEGTSVYGLSYLDDIAFTWVDQAIYGLETMLPFCVKGFLEPNRFLCTVSYWNCHIVCEEDGREAPDREELINEFSHTSMLEFCRLLHDDIRQNLEDWALFSDDPEVDAEGRKAALSEKLARLQRLISEREPRFTDHRCFL